MGGMGVPFHPQGMVPMGMPGQDQGAQFLAHAPPPQMGPAGMGQQQQGGGEWRSMADPGNNANNLHRVSGNRHGVE